ncbi:hypothetical protein PR048_004201 [Dryococelus australis]|uniref:Uncharacterized protein n=1 Tax=Dryococelus australis TaxID=614101 RepID=A0ABQ9I4T9_9NEOP|nr:hypothetical protein PR048_004201 [Dryococelus australis]
MDKPRCLIDSCCPAMVTLCDFGSNSTYATLMEAGGEELVEQWGLAMRNVLVQYMERPSACSWLSMLLQIRSDSRRVQCRSTLNSEGEVDLVSSITRMQEQEKREIPEKSPPGRATAVKLSNCLLLTEAIRVRSLTQSPGFLHVGILLDNVTGWQDFSGISRFPRPCIRTSITVHNTVLRTIATTERTFTDPSKVVSGRGRRVKIPSHSTGQSCKLVFGDDKESPLPS